MIPVLLFSLLFNISTQKSTVEDTDFCHSKNELELFELINEIRVKNGHKEIPISPSLSIVAQIHAKDLIMNEPLSSKCNAHSWSDRGEWDKCCYEEDHSNAECMWGKPRELTNYQGDGYEIVAFWRSGDEPNTPISPEIALNLWIKSSGHSDVIFNRKSFGQVAWNAMGVGIYEHYASVWFGIAEDMAPPLHTCHND